MRKYITKISGYIDRKTEFWNGENKAVCKLIEDIENAVVDKELESLHLRDRLNSALRLIKELDRHSKIDSDHDKAETFLKLINSDDEDNLPDERVYELISSNEKPLESLDYEAELIQKYIALSKNFEEKCLDNFKLREEIFRLKGNNELKKTC